MDDELRRKIAASLDLPADAAADPDVVRAMELDPAAEGYRRGLRTIDRAMRRWPAPVRAASDWERAVAALEAGLDEAARESSAARVTRGARAQGGPAVSPADADPAAVPRFDDDPAPPMEINQAMSEPNENDADLEHLAALTRTSAGPGALASLPTRPVGVSITDAVDDTSSGVVDIKHLARVARESAPAPAVVSAPAAQPAAEVKSPAREPEVKSLADLVSTSDAGKKPAGKKDDVMVAPAAAPRATPASVTAPPRRGSALWGALGGVAVSAAAFVLYLNTRGTASLDRASGGDSPAAEGASTSASPPAEMPTAAQPPPPQAMAQAAPPSAPVPTLAPVPTPAPALAVAPAPAPEPSGAAGAPAAQPPAVGAPVAVTAPVPMPVTARIAAAEPAGAVAATPPADHAARRAAPTAPGPAPVATRDALAETARPGAAAHRAGAHPAAADHAAEASAPAAPTPTPAAAPATAVRGGAAGGGAEGAHAESAGSASSTHGTTAAATAPPAGGQGRSIDDLLNAAAPSHSAPAQQTVAAPAADLPERLSRPQVSGVMTPLASGARACTQGQTGTAPVAITIGNDGVVRAASVSGQFAGTPAGDCIANLVRRAHFPAFRQPQASFVWPFVILPPR